MARLYFFYGIATQEIQIEDWLRRIGDFDVSQYFLFLGRYNKVETRHAASLPSNSFNSRNSPFLKNSNSPNQYFIISIRSTMRLE